MRLSGPGQVFQSRRLQPSACAWTKTGVRLHGRFPDQCQRPDGVCASRGVFPGGPGGLGRICCRIKERAPLIRGSAAWEKPGEKSRDGQCKSAYWKDAGCCRRAFHGSCVGIANPGPGASENGNGRRTSFSRRGETVAPLCFCPFGCKSSQDNTRFILRCLPEKRTGRRHGTRLPFACRFGIRKKVDALPPRQGRPPFLRLCRPSFF